MRGTHRRQIRPDEAEQLLATGRDPSRPELDRLLAAATAPPRPHELAGLEEALAAFQEAGRARRPAPAKQRWRVLRPLAAAAATAVVLVGGVAVAAEVGYLPGVERPAAQEGLGPREAPSTTAQAGPSATSGPTSTRTADPTRGAQTEQPGNSKLDRLCRTWDDRRRKDKPMKPQDLRELSAAAGGEDRIPAYCAPRLHPPGKGPASPPPHTGPSANQPSPALSGGGDSDNGDEDDDAPKNQKKPKEDE
ncbi:hypothetical protein [Phytohabitans flavus]